MGIAFAMFSTVALATNNSEIRSSFSAAAVHPDVTPLCIAIQKGETELVRKLIEYGADVNEKSSGMTPLMVAARYNKVEILKLLLASGAHSHLKDEKGFTALKYAELSLANEAVIVLKQA